MYVVCVEALNPISLNPISFLNPKSYTKKVFVGGAERIRALVSYPGCRQETAAVKGHLNSLF